MVVTVQTEGPLQEVERPVHYRVVVEVEPSGVLPEVLPEEQVLMEKYK
jgi:hypothetical protein